MLKLWGAALTAIGCAALGLRRGQDLKQGVDTLNQLLQGLTLLEHEAAAWLDREHLRSVKWLPADEAILDEIDGLLQ